MTRVDGLDPSLKYRIQVTYGDGEAPAATGTLDLKVAFGSNKFTVAKAPTLYKQDPYAPMDIHLNATSQAQQIDHVTIKNAAKTDFAISGSDHDWTLWYVGQNPSKLKTTTLTLEIFLKGNETTKPNATTNVKVTVK